MSKSISRAQTISGLKQNQLRHRAFLPDKLNNNQFVALLVQFYREAEGSNFYAAIDRAMAKKGYFFTDPQREIAECMLASVFMKERREVYISIVRQFGKTELVSMVTEFCYRHYSEIFGTAFSVAIIAPEKGTATEVFSRIKNYIVANETDLLIDTKFEVKTLAGDTIRLYGIYDGATGGTIEGRTFDMIIRDEAHKGSERKWLDEVMPAANRTTGPIILIGNGGFKDCYFYRGLKKGTNVSKKHYVFRYTYNSLRPYMLDLAAKGLDSCRVWVENTDKYIENLGGRKSLFVRKNILCEWDLKLGGFLDIESVESVDEVIEDDIHPDIFLTYDVAHSGMDRAIATVVDRNKNILDLWVIKDIGEVVTLEKQANILYDRCLESGLMNFDGKDCPLKCVGVDASGLGVGMAEMMEKLFPIPIKRFTFTTQAKMDWYFHLRDSVVAEIPSSRVRFNRHKQVEDGDELKNEPLYGYAKLKKPFATADQWDICHRELCDLEVIELKNDQFGFHAPVASGGVMGLSVHDDFVASMAMALSLVGYWDGFHPTTLTSRSRRLFSGEALPESHLSMAAPVDELPHWTGDSRPGTVPPRLKELRQKAKRVAPRQN